MTGSGHLECVKWLVANRAHIQGEDNFGRTPMELAEQFNHSSCVDFLRVCIRELSNPRSTFAQMHGRQQSSNLPPIEEDAGSSSTGSPWRDDTKIKGEVVGESDDEDTKKPLNEEEKKRLEEKRKLYDAQHQRMENQGVSFLDSIRQEVDSD